MCSGVTGGTVKGVPPSVWQRRKGRQSPCGSHDIETAEPRRGSKQIGCVPAQTRRKHRENQTMQQGKASSPASSGPVHRSCSEVAMLKTSFIGTNYLRGLAITLDYRRQKTTLSR